MSTFFARNRLIILAYIGMLVLLLVTALFSPGFLSESNLRATVVLAAFVGIVALGQTFVMIGSGIDLSVPWVLNSGAILMTLLCAGQDLPLLWVVPLVLAGGATIGLLNGIGVGNSYLFTLIAAVAIGGASILGGSGHYLSTVAGALVLTILTGLLPALHLSSGALLVVYGAVILLTVSIGSETFATLWGLAFRTQNNRKPGE
ncbi:MAG: hypothetical protein Q8L54_08440 [Devosia sp.]|nr:hypothetical protein [Devosia sp.]